MTFEIPGVVTTNGTTPEGENGRTDFVFFDRDSKVSRALTLALSGNDSERRAATIRTMNQMRDNPTAYGISEIGGALAILDVRKIAERIDKIDRDPTLTAEERLQQITEFVQFVVDHEMFHTLQVTETFGRDLTDIMNSQSAEPSTAGGAMLQEFGKSQLKAFLNGISTQVGQ